MRNRAIAVTLFTAAAFIGLGAAPVKADDDTPPDHRIGYITSAMHWSVYQSDKVSEDCPDGLNSYGPRETFRALFPEGGSVEKTELVREAARTFPQDGKALFPYILAKGPIAIGMNLDGKVGPNDLVSPTGEKGIKNQLSRVIGCSSHFRTPEGQIQLFGSKYIKRFTFDRIMIELSNVDSLTNADHVDVAIYRGRDPLLLDATGEKVAPGGTQRIDWRYGKALVQHLHGKIVDGVLTTEPVKSGAWVWQIWDEVPVVLRMHDMRLRFKLTPNSAEGEIASYIDVKSWYRWVTSWSTHHLAYGQLDPSEFYWALRQNADAYPDQDGAMTAISSALTVTMSQVYVDHGDEKMAANDRP